MRDLAFYFLLFGIHLLVPTPWHIFSIAALIHPTQRSAATLRRFIEFFLTRSLATCLETSRGGAEFSKPYSEEEQQDRGITLGLHYVISELYNAVSSVLDSYLVEPFHFDQSKKRY